MSFDRAAYNKKYYRLHKEQILGHDKDYYKKHKERILAEKKLYTVTHKREKAAYDKIYRKTHKEERRIKWKEYWRNHVLARVSGVLKRPYTGYCELCGKVIGEGINRLHYHHWDNNDIVPGKKVKGIWVCWGCHQICELVEKNKLHLIQRYLRFKRALNKKQKIQEKIKPEFN